MKKLSITEFLRMAGEYLPGAQFVFDTRVQTDGNIFLPHARGIHSYHNVGSSLSPNMVWFYNQSNNEDDRLVFYCVKHIEVHKKKNGECVNCIIVCEGSFGGECRYKIILKK